MDGEYLYTTLERQGHVSVLTQMTRANRTCHAVRVSKTEYMLTSTGTVKEFERHAENRAGNKKSLLNTFAKIRGIVNANVTDPRRVKFVTLTYAENMTDPKQLYCDFKSYWQRLLYWHKKRGWSRPEYILVVEPQQRGAWHGHLLLIYPDKAPFFPEGEIDQVWRHGFVKISRIDHVDNLGAYLSAYLSDIAIDAEEGDEDAVMIDGERKAIIKGGRLHMYPPGMNIFRCSRGVKRPQKTVITEAAADAHREQYEVLHETSRALRDPQTGFETEIRQQWFDDRRKRKKDGGECC